MNEDNSRQLAMVRFEPAGWRATGDETPAMTLEQAFNKAVDDTMAFLDENASSEPGYVLELPEPGQFLHAILPARLVPQLESQPFVAREYPDQVKSTLQILSMG